MATSQGRQQKNRRRTTYRDEYVYGNTVRKLDVREAIKEEPRREKNYDARKNREKAHHMNLGYVSFLMLAIVVSGVVLIQYIQLQAEITNQVKEIAALESSLNTLRQENDETYSRLMSSIDLEEIKRIAIGELGMTYATEDQVITYTNETSDYVRQYCDIPE